MLHQILKFPYIFLLRLSYKLCFVLFLDLSVFLLNIPLIWALWLPSIVCVREELLLIDKMMQQLLMLRFDDAVAVDADFILLLIVLISCQSQSKVPYRIS